MSGRYKGTNGNFAMIAMELGGAKNAAGLDESSQNAEIVRAMEGFWMSIPSQELTEILLRLSLRLLGRLQSIARESEARLTF